VADHVLQHVKALLAEKLADTDGAVVIHDDAHIINDLWLDSLQMISFLLDLETRLGAVLDFDALELDHLGAVRDFAAYLERSMQSPLR
jgi:acyl carrier protein